MTSFFREFCSSFGEQHNLVFDDEDDVVALVVVLFLLFFCSKSVAV